MFMHLDTVYQQTEDLIVHTYDECRCAGNVVVISEKSMHEKCCLKFAMVSRFVITR